MANGLGALLYVVFWAVLPAAPASAAGAGAAAVDAGRSRLQAVGLVALAGGVLLVLIQVGGFGIDGTLVALAAVIALGAGIIWHQADPQRRRRPSRSTPGHRAGGAVADRHRPRWRRPSRSATVAGCWSASAAAGCWW